MLFTASQMTSVNGIMLILIYTGYLKTIYLYAFHANSPDVQFYPATKFRSKGKKKKK